MKSGGKMLFCLLSAVALTLTVRAMVNDSAPSADNRANASGDQQQPYSAIWARNVFALTPKEDPASTKPPETEPPANIKLVGILTIFGKKQAMLTLEEHVGRPMPGQPPKKEEYYTMTEGERRGALEVLEIDPKARTVKIKNEEVASTITFETNRPAGGPPTAPQNMAGGIPRPNTFNPPGMPMNNGFSAPLPSRSMRPSAQYSPQGNTQPGGYGLGAAGYATGYVQPGSQPTTTPGLSIPGSMFSQPTTGQKMLAPMPQVPSAEQQIIDTAIQGSMPGYLDQVAAGKIPPLPPPPPGFGGSTDPSALNLPPPPQYSPQRAPWMIPKTTGSLH